MNTLFGSSLSTGPTVMGSLRPPLLGGAMKGDLPSDAEFEAHMLGVIKRASAGDGQGIQGADTRSDFAAEPAALHQLCPQSPVIQRIKCPAAQTLSPPLAVGKVYRAEQQTYPPTLAGWAANEPTDLVGAFYPQSPVAPSPVSPAAAAANTFAHNVHTSRNVVAWQGIAEPQTPTANILQQPVAKEVQTGTPRQYLPPPPPPPRPVPIDDPLLRREQLYQDKLRKLEEREKIVSRSIDQLKVDRAYVLGIHAENQARTDRHALASKELEAQANILRRAAHQQQVKEAELATKEALLIDAYKALEVAQDKVRQSEAALLRQKQGLQKEIEAVNLAQLVKMLLDAPKLANSAAEAAITAGCPQCAERALQNLAKVEPAYEKTMAEHLKALASSDNSDDLRSPRATPIDPPQAQARLPTRVDTQPRPKARGLHALSLSRRPQPPTSRCALPSALVFQQAPQARAASRCCSGEQWSKWYA